jgi:antitoxin HicB
MTNRFYPIVVVDLSEEDGGGFAAYAPDLYGCMSDGETPEEAVANLKDAIQEWCAEMVRLERKIPEPHSAVNAVREERQALIALIQEQDKLLQEQDRAVGRLQSELSALKSRVFAFLDRENDAEHNICSGWAAGRSASSSGMFRTYLSIRPGGDLPH